MMGVECRVSFISIEKKRFVFFFFQKRKIQEGVFYRIKKNIPYTHHPSPQ